MKICGVIFIELNLGISSTKFIQRLGIQVLITENYLSHLHDIHHLRSVLNGFISGSNFTATYTDAEENILESGELIL